MGLLIFPSVWVHMLMFSSLGILCAGDDRRLLPGNPISINQTLTSSDGTFALGFFSPENSTTRRYAGIWYNNLPGRTVVWVANREAPLEGASGVLAVTADGNIALLDGDGTAVWSTNLSGIPTNTSAELLDSGNLVLADTTGDGGGGYLWQSFDNPTDHYLPTMQLRLDLKTGRGQSLVAWRDPQDPSPGRFSLGIDPRSPLQVVLREGSRIRWRGGPWSARQAVGSRDDSGSSMFVEYSAADEERVSVSYAGTGAFALSRYVLRPTGEIDVLYWNHRASNWSLIGSLPDGPCEIYEPCGPFGYCELDGPSALCRCLQGFEPKDEKDWAVGNFSGGCVRRLPLAIDRTDAFLKSDAMKLPDKFSVSWNVSAGQCEAACLEHRRCTAYAFANLSGGDSVGSRCLLWDGELLDLARRVNTGEDLFVRVAASELGPYVQRAKSSSKDRTLVLVLFPSLATGVLLLGIFGCFLKRRIKKQGKRKNNEQVLVSDLDVSNTLTDITQLPLIDFSTVMAATNNFSAANKLGEGGFGPVYKGILQTGHEIAIKRLSKGSGQGQEEFKNEVALIAKLQHRNLVRLLGYCIHDDERILIYEHMCNNSLDHFLFDATRQAQLHWAMRFNIIKGIARGLMYLHQDSRFKIVHRDLKASNILLDEGMNPKISDFGMARIFGGGQHEGRTNRVVGTFGYMSPEYAMRGLFSMKSDVYSFGVLLLEIINGQRNNSFYHNEVFINLLSYAWQLWTEDKVMEFLDASIAQTCSLVEVSRCMLVGLLCVQDRVIERPSMSSVVFMLENHTPIYGTPKRPMFMLDRGLWRGELPRKSISVSNLTITRIEGR